MNLKKAYRTLIIAASAAGKIVSKSGALEVKFYTKNSVGTGAQANNPHLQEMPDPISKVSWDNYVTMNPSDMEGKYETRNCSSYSCRYGNCYGKWLYHGTASCCGSRSKARNYWYQP